MKLLLSAGKTKELSSVLQKLWMIVWFGEVTMKLIFSHGKLYPNFGKFEFLSQDGREV